MAHASTPSGNDDDRPPDRPIPQHDQQVAHVYQAAAVDVQTIAVQATKQLASNCALLIAWSPLRLLY